MKVELEKSLALPVAADAGWHLVENIEGIATCMPGARITERIDATHYKGTITVKLGPATVNFKGEIEVTDCDPATRTIHLVGKGADTTGGSGASLDLTAQVTATGPESCVLAGRSEVNVTGKVAAFGSRLMGTVTDQLLKIFFANLLARAQEIQAAQAAPAPAPAPAEATATPAAASLPPPPAPPVETRLNALAFAWAVLKDFFRGLFHRTRAS